MEQKWAGGDSSRAGVLRRRAELMAVLVVEVEALSRLSFSSIPFVPSLVLYG
jgi:hypothetical protein